MTNFMEKFRFRRFRIRQNMWWIRYRLYSNADLLDTFLNYKERLHCSESLLLIKKWGDFLVRFSKQQQKPHLHFQLNALNLEIAIQARKEHNFQLASRHLVQNLDTDQVSSDLLKYFPSCNWNIFHFLIGIFSFF